MSEIAAPAATTQPTFLENLQAALSPQHLWESTCAWVSRNPQTSLYIAIAVLVVILLLLLRSRRRRRDFRVYREQSGSASISPRALRHLIHLASEDVGIVGSPKIRFRQSRNRINIAVAVKLRQDQRIGQIHERLRERIHTTFETTHGILVGDVNLKVIGFKKGNTTADATAGTASADTYAPLSGTTFPATADDDASATSADTVLDTHDADTAKPRKNRFSLFGHRDAANGNADDTATNDDTTPDGDDTTANPTPSRSSAGDNQ